MLQKKRLIVFASGTDTGGGSGFEKLCLKSQTSVLDNATIVAVVSNHEHGGVRKRAEKFGIPFIYFPKDYTSENYRKIVSSVNADFTALSGWIKKVSGLNPKTTLNIHPGPLPMFGGKGMYGHHVHEAVMQAYNEGRITHSAITMHFVTPEYDKGPTFFCLPIEISKDDTPETLGDRVNEQEHTWQSHITNLVLKGMIGWDGKNPDSIFGEVIF